MAYLNKLQEINKVKINDLEFDPAELKEIQVIQSGDNKYFVNINGRQIQVKWVPTDSPRQYSLVIDQQSYEVTLIRNIDVQVEAMNFSQRLSLNTEAILAPMPGLVKKISVSVGEEVIKGQHLLTLEAMKMENLIKSPHSGKVKSILAIAGTAVEKNQVLITF
ncbi:MAG: biotin/lipoyl-containing protein [Saprospiraceae bacterium]